MYKGVNVYLGVIVSKGPAVGLLLCRFEYSLVRVCVCMYVCVCMRMCIYMYVCMCVYVCMYIYVYVCVYMYLLNFILFFCEFWKKTNSNRKVTIREIRGRKGMNK